METCRATDCDRPAVIRAEQLCRKHYMRLKRKGSIGDQRKNARKECSISGCGALVAAHGLCDKHYRRTRYQAVRHEGRSCDHCHAPIAPERRITAKYCSTECKVQATQPARARRYQLKRKYGITDKEFDAMLTRQNGRCAICGTTDPKGRGQRFHVDHCHDTNEVRGILCHECNVGLGHFKDDPGRLRRAIRYLSNPMP